MIRPSAPAVGVALDKLEDSTASGRQLLPGDEIAVMLHDADQDLIAFLKESAVAVRDQIQALRGVSRKDDLLRTGRADEFSHSLPRILINRRRSLGEVIEPAQRIGIVALIKMADCFDHTGRLLGRRCVVQINQRGVISENREILPDIHFCHSHSPSGIPDRVFP